MIYQMLILNRLPQILLMHEELEWTKRMDINYYTYASDISVNGFRLNYYINGRATLSVMRVRWVAVLD